MAGIDIFRAGEHEQVRRNLLGFDLDLVVLDSLPCEGQGKSRHSRRDQQIIDGRSHMPCSLRVICAEHSTDLAQTLTTPSALVKRRAATPPLARRGNRRTFPLLLKEGWLRHQ